MINVYLTFWGTAKLFSKLPVLFHIPTNDVYGFQLFHIFVNNGYCYNFSSLVDVVLLIVAFYFCFLVFGFCFVFKPYFEISLDVPKSCKASAENSLYL